MVHFLAPLFLAGLVGIGLPLWLHLRGRAHARIIRFAAIDFLLASQKKMARRLRLRQLLLLAVRVGAIAAIPLAFAKPYAEREVDLPGTTLRAQSAVIVLDDSASMRWQNGSESLFTRARDRASEILGLLGPGSSVALVLGSERSALPIPGLTTDRGLVARTLASLQPSLRAPDLAEAVKRATQMLASAPLAERRIYVIGDGGVHAWGTEAPPAPGGSPEVVLIDVASERTPANHGIAAVEVSPAPELGKHGVRVVADLVNYTDRPVAGLPVTLRVGTTAVARGLADVPAQGRISKTFYHALPGPGFYDATVELPADGLPDDDRRFARIEARDAIRLLLASGDPRTIRREDELFYLETALRSSGREGASIDLQSTPADAFPQDLSPFDVVALCNVKAPSAERVALLRSFVERGGGLLLTLGENVDADAYNRAFGDLLPQPLQDRRLTSPQAGSTMQAQPAARIGSLDRRHPILRVFPAQAAGLFAAHFESHFLLAPRPDDRTRHTLIRFESGAPLLVELERGSGRVLLYASTIDRDWNDLPIRPDFLPLVEQMVRHLARIPIGEVQPPSLVGHPHRLRVAPQENRADVIRPSGGRAVVERHAEGDLVYDATDEVGFYRVEVGSARSAQRARPELAFAVNLDPKVSDYRKADRAQVALDSPAAGTKQAPRQRSELAHLVAAALLGFLLIETISGGRS